MKKSTSFRHTFYYYTNQSDYFRLLGIFRYKGTEEVRMHKQGKKIFIRSFGCQMNDVDSEVMERLEREGYRKTDSPEGGHVIILKNNN